MPLSMQPGGGAFNPSEPLNTGASWIGSASSGLNSAGQYIAENPTFLSDHHINLNLPTGFGQNLQTAGNGLGMIGGGAQATAGLMDFYGR